jgi:Pectate lyase superfamily protein
MQPRMNSRCKAFALSLLIGLAAISTAIPRVTPALADDLARAGDTANHARISLVQTAGTASLLQIDRRIASRTLHNYASPQVYGARGDGVTDDSAAFESALSHGDLLVPPATYLIDRNIRVPSYRNIQCEPGAILHTTRHDGNESGVITFDAADYSSVTGCTITGSNTTSVPVLDRNQWNYLIWIRGPSRNIVVSGNTLKYSWANSALHIDGDERNPNVPSIDILISHNDFESNGYYGVAIISGNHVSVLHNRFVDSSCCAESNNPATDQSMYNVYAYNYMTSVKGNAATCRNCDSGIFFTGGESPNNFNYATDRVYDNYIMGNNTRLITSADSGATPPKYTNNQCVNGCKEQ